MPAPLTLRFTKKDNPAVFHDIRLVLQQDKDPPTDMHSLDLEAIYIGGCVNSWQGILLAKWRPLWQAPAKTGDPGFASLSDGSIRIDERARGLGLGSILMHFVIGWLKGKANAPLSAVTLAAEDATPENHERRNKFYTKLGLKFAWQSAAQLDGWSHDMTSHELIQPPLQASRGWEVEVRY